MYLATAEKYRLQNLTPDLFEKYLPYAIIFNVEKKWGRAFASVTMESPSWYSGQYHSWWRSGASVSRGGLVAGRGFSPSVFSSSFSSSFSSTFLRSGGGGFSGGGGGAGGGGGGGGGGAS